MADEDVESSAEDIRDGGKSAPRLRATTRLQKIGTAIACAAAFPASKAKTAALLFTGLATRAAASWAQRVIRGEVDPSRIMDRSVSAEATESDKKSGKTGLKEP